MSLPGTVEPFFLSSPLPIQHHSPILIFSNSVYWTIFFNKIISNHHIHIWKCLWSVFTNMDFLLSTHTSNINFQFSSIFISAFPFSSFPNPFPLKIKSNHKNIKNLLEKPQSSSISFH
jgi:hypothetical protein